jgi:hypothetical protein
MAVRLWALCASRPLPPGRYVVLISVRGRFDPRAIVQLEELGQLRNLMTSSGIKLATFQFVAQCLNQVCYRMLKWYDIDKDNISPLFN